ncbi:MAG: CPBP family intramembrane metalloprotease [Chloroflexia bacterium]|nr:CPBP family intramembrane metalloprotease [Chloroflexia bacterium]
MKLSEVGCPPAWPMLVRRSPGLRSGLYLSSMVAVLWLASRVPRPSTDLLQLHLHTVATPGVLIMTECFVRLQPEGPRFWLRWPQVSDVRHGVIGGVLGASALTSMLAVAARLGWVSAPAWGWEVHPHRPVEVLLAATSSAAQTVFLVFNEEMVFRGYGFDTLHAALGLPGATLVSAALFGRYHGPGFRRWLGLSVAGLFLTFVRRQTGTLWCGAGFHFAWNVMQEAVFGPEDGLPSLRPLRVHGPPAWIGKPGTPEPGWLQVLTTVILAVLAGLALWRTRRQANQHEQG